jgi:hypothetical protein
MILRSNLPKLREFGGRSARVLDAGGWYRPFNLATHVIDVNPYESRRVDDALDPKTTSVLLPIPGSDKAPPSPTRSRKLKFAIDSALEQRGFELVVPPRPARGATTSECADALSAPSMSTGG